MTVQISHLEARVTSDGYVLLANRIGDAERSAQTFERQFAKIEEIQRRAEKAAERAAATVERSAKREAQAWNDAVQKAKALDEQRVASAEKAANKQLESVMKELLSEEQAIRASEDRRRRIILSNTELTEAERVKLLKLSAIKQREQLSKQGAGLGWAGAAVVGGAALAGAAVVGHSMLDTTREFDKLNASLLTVTGSEKEAASAFEALQAFAIKTPFTLREVVDAFVQLRNLGLNATGRELTAFSNMAAAFGDTLSHMLLAVGDAAMGINRPLKQFGVMAEASKNTSKKLTEDGKTVTFTFRGVSTEVEQSALKIQEYLVKLAETNFANAMANRMKTLDGAISNLRDSWDKFTLALTQSGLEATLSGAVSNASELLNVISDMVKKVRELKNEAPPPKDPTKSGSFPEIGDTTLGNLSSRQAVIAGFAQYLKNRQAAGMEAGKNDLASLEKFRADAKKMQDEKYREEYRQLVKELKTKRELIEESYRKEKEVIASGVSGNAELDARMSAAAKKKHDDAIASLDKKDGASGRRAAKQYERDLQSEDPLYKASQEFDRRQKEIDKFEKSGSDAWERWTNANLDKYAKDVANFHNAQNQKLEAVRKELRDQEETIEAAYSRRKYIIEKNSVGSDRDELLKDLERKREAETAAFYAKKAAEAKQRQSEEERTRRGEVEFQQRVRNFGKEPSQIEMLNRKYSGQQFDLKELFATKIKGDEGDPFQTDSQLKAQELFKQKSVDIERERIRELNELQMQMVQNSLQSSEAMFGSLATAAKNWGGENSSTYRAMFAAQKAFAVASATVSMAHGISSAMDKGWPEGIPIAISAAAEGAKILAMISSTNYSGAYDEGGNIPAGKLGIVGEYGPEFVRGPAVVTSRADTARMMSDGFGGGGQQPINITVVNSRDGRANSYRASSAREKVLVADARKNKSAMQRVVGG